MKTIKELEVYLEENGYSFQELTIGNHYAHQGYIVEQEKGSYNFSCSERGHKIVLKSFEKEEELVKYALDTINKSEWAKAHLLACVFDESEILEIERILRGRNVEYRRNDIPNYKEGKRAYRVFVFGNDIIKLEDIKEKY